MKTNLKFTKPHFDGFLERSAEGLVKLHSKDRRVYEHNMRAAT